MLDNVFAIEQFAKARQDMLLEEVQHRPEMEMFQMRDTTEANHVTSRLFVSIGNIFIAVGKTLKRHYGHAQPCEVSTHSVC